MRREEEAREGSCGGDFPSSCHSRPPPRPPLSCSSLPDRLPHTACLSHGQIFFLVRKYFLLILRRKSFKYDIRVQNQRIITPNSFLRFSYFCDMQRPSQPPCQYFGAQRLKKWVQRPKSECRLSTSTSTSHSSQIFCCADNYDRPFTNFLHTDTEMMMI